MIPSHYMKKFIAVGITSNTITISFLNSALEDCSKMIEPLNTCGQAFGLPEGGPRERERERERFTYTSIENASSVLVVSYPITIITQFVSIYICYYMNVQTTCYQQCLYIT